MAYRIALAGNPNSGKTSIFNELTGSTQYVGNWPGVTVEKKEGILKNDKRCTIVDLPGIYSLSPYTLEEVVTRDYLLDGRPDVIINIVDATNLERNLYLTTQLMETGIPLVLALNMIDVIRRSGDAIDTRVLAQLLGCPVIETSAVTGVGLKELVQVAIASAESASQGLLQAGFSEDTERALCELNALLGDTVPPTLLRWYAIKLFEQDEKVLARLNLSETTLSEIKRIIDQAETKLDDSAESIITNERYNHIALITARCLVRKARFGTTTISDKIDRVVTNRWLALPISPKCCK